MHRVVALTALAWGLGHLIQPGVRVALPPVLSAAADRTATPSEHGFSTLVLEPLGAEHLRLRDTDDVL